MRLTRTFEKKASKKILSARHFEVFFLFLSIKYGADLGRSRLVKKNRTLYDLRDSPITHFDYLTYENLNINKSLELLPPIRPYYTYLPQTFTSEITSDVSLQTIPSTSNVLVNTHSFGGSPLPVSQHPSPTCHLPPASTFYDPYASLHPSFPNFPVSSFQPPFLPPNPCPQPQTSTQSFNPLTSQPPPPVLQMTPSVPFAALPNKLPIKLSDDLDHTYPSGKESVKLILSPRVTFQLGPQPLDIQ